MDIWTRLAGEIAVVFSPGNVCLIEGAHPVAQRPIAPLRLARYI